MSVTIIVRDAANKIEIGPAESIIPLLRENTGRVAEFITGSESDFFRVEVWGDGVELVIIDWRGRVPTLELMERLGIFRPGIFGNDTPANFG